jgi:hypothetical protein
MDSSRRLRQPLEGFEFLVAHPRGRSCEKTKTRKWLQKLFSISSPTSDYSHLGIHFASPQEPHKSLANRFFHRFVFKGAGFLTPFCPYPAGRFRSVLSSRAWSGPLGRRTRTIHKNREVCGTRKFNPPPKPCPPVCEVGLRDPNFSFAPRFPSNPRFDGPEIRSRLHQLDTHLSAPPVGRAETNDSTFQFILGAGIL